MSSLFEAIFGKTDYSKLIPGPVVWHSTGYQVPMLTPELTKKSLELLVGCAPETNIIPTAALVAEAWRMGYDVILKPKAKP